MAKRGRKLGVPHGVRKGSGNDFLLSMEVGDYSYIETTATEYQNVMRTVNTPKTRRPPELAGHEFMCNLYRGVGPRVEDEVKILVRIERLC